MESNDSDKKNSYIDFKIGKECYALSVSKVLEIIQLEQITKIPNSSEFILGVINFRGSVVPVIDMHKRFNISDKKDSTLKMLIVVDICEMS